MRMPTGTHVETQQPKHGEGHTGSFVMCWVTRGGVGTGPPVTGDGPRMSGVSGQLHSVTWAPGRCPHQNQWVPTPPTARHRSGPWCALSEQQVFYYVWRNKHSYNRQNRDSKYTLLCARGLLKRAVLSSSWALTQTFLLGAGVGG